MLNKVVIMGRLVRAPELRRTQTGTAVTSFTIACQRDFTQSGESITDFFDCAAWRHTAEFISRYFDKGQAIIISGRLQVRSWTDREGEKHYRTEIVAENAYFAGGNKTSGSEETYAEEDYASPFSEISDEDGDLPF